MTITHTVIDLGMCETWVEVDGQTVECDRPATHKIVGEQDSFGVEYMYFCDSCADGFYDRQAAAYDRELEARRNTPCQWCKRSSDTLRPYRQYDDPAYEPQQWVCRECRDRDAKERDEELCGYEMADARRSGGLQECRCGTHTPEYWCDFGMHWTDQPVTTRVIPLIGSWRASVKETCCPSCTDEAVQA